MRDRERQRENAAGAKQNAAKKVVEQEQKRKFQRKHPSKGRALGLEEGLPKSSHRGWRERDPTLEIPQR